MSRLNPPFRAVLVRVLLRNRRTSLAPSKGHGVHYPRDGFPSGVNNIACFLRLDRMALVLLVCSVMRRQIGALILAAMVGLTSIGLLTTVASGQPSGSVTRECCGHPGPEKP